MTTFHQVRRTDTFQRLGLLLEQFPDEYDSEFDDGLEELNRQFAEFRLTFDHN